MFLSCLVLWGGACAHAKNVRYGNFGNFGLCGGTVLHPLSLRSPARVVAREARKSAGFGLSRVRRLPPPERDANRQPDGVLSAAATHAIIRELQQEEKDG